jgi:y4mF family transcriptional regulator
MRYKNSPLSRYIKAQRALNGLTQPDLARKAGVGLRFVRDLEQGKETIRLDKVNQVLSLFGAQVGVVPQGAPSDREGGQS